MPATDAGWRARSGAEWTEDIRGELDSAFGFSPGYDATIEEGTGHVGRSALIDLIATKR